MTASYGYRNDVRVDRMNDLEFKDDITTITTNNFTERAPSVVDDDVGSINNGSNLDLVPVREKECDRIYKTSFIPESIEIVDVYPQSCEGKDDYEMDHDNDRTRWRSEVDEYDLNNGHRCYGDNNRFSDEDLHTVIHRPQPLVTLTRHESPHCDVRHRHVSPVHEHSPPMHRLPPGEYDNVCRHSLSTDSTGIGRQITQLAQRIESLGNISRVYQEEVDPRCDQDCEMICHEATTSDHIAIKTARKLDEVERLQRRQEAMQSRLTDLAKKLSDSTRDLSRPIPYNENMSNDEGMHATLPKTARRAIKKGVQKNSKNAKKSSSSFLKNILNDIGETKSNEAPLVCSTYCLHNDLSSGSPASVVTDATNKYVNDELNNIRHEFRTQVEEIRRLLSERYQQAAVVDSKQHTVHHHTHESLADQIDKSMSKVRRDTSPSLRNITNISRYEDQSCPLDKYLTKRPLDCELPSLESDITPSLRPGILPSVAKAIKSKQRMFSDPIEAERFLVELRNRRANLENNISSLERAKEGQFLFAILEKLQGNESSFEIARIQAMVDDAIVSMNPEIQWEVKQEYHNWLEKRRERQLKQEAEDQQQHSGQIKHPKCTKIVQHINYNQLPSTSSVPRKPWLCKKYWSVRSKVDTGLRKPDRSGTVLHRPYSPTKQIVAPSHETRSTWCNRRRYRTPYLHFVNDIKLAKKSIGPLGDETRRIPIIGSSKKQVTETSVDYQRPGPGDNLIPLGVRQYSLNYDEEDLKVDKPRSIARATSPKTESKSERVHRPPTPPSPSLSEMGTGFHLQSRKSSKPREERVGPFIAIDPSEETKMTAHPINVMFRQPERQRREPDINNLRHLIERAIYDQIEIPSPTTSTDLTLSAPKGSIISTPIPSERIHYSEDFGSDSPRDRTDISVTMIEGIRTPDLSTDHDRNVRFETPPASPNRSLRQSPKRQMITEKLSEAVQTISDKGNQTIEDRGMQTCSPARTQTPKESRKPESTESFSTTSGLEYSLSDTQVESWSDGMWLLDRSEGEMAKHYLQPVSRWNLGSCPDHPLWPHGTEDLVHVDRDSPQSFGEFIKPTLPGLVPTVDGMLQLKTLPFKQDYDSFNVDDEYLDSFRHRRPKDDSFKLIRMSRDSKSKLTTPRSAPGPSGAHSQNSEGEVNLSNDYDDEDNFVPIKNQSNRSNRAPPAHHYDMKRSNDSNYLPSNAFDKDESLHPIEIRRSNDSNQTDLTGPYRESYSDRMKIDPMTYLRASKQSQSDFSDTGGLMSTGQVIAAAFKGGDSADFEGYSDHLPDNQNYHRSPLTHDPSPSNKVKQTVRIPTMDSIEQSDRSQSDLSEIILQ